MKLMVSSLTAVNVQGRRKNIAWLTGIPKGETTMDIANRYMGAGTPVVASVAPTEPKMMKIYCIKAISIPVSWIKKTVVKANILAMEGTSMTKINGRVPLMVSSLN